MKENSLDSHRGKVAESSKAAAAAAVAALNTTTQATSVTTNSETTCAAAATTTTTTAVSATTTTTTSASAAISASSAATNFDDDYNEWELGIGDLIIDLDADIEKNNSGSGSSSSTTTTTTNNPTTGNSATTTGSSSAAATSTGGSTANHSHQGANNFAMSSGKNKLNSSTSTSSGSGGGGGGAGTGGGGATGSASVEHQATVDKGLKMKIKRTKPTKTSEAKHEIVKPDVKADAGAGAAVNGTATPAGAAPASTAAVGAGSELKTGAASAAAAKLTVAPASEGGTTTNGTTTSTTGLSSSGAVEAVGTAKSKHASSKGRGGSHREKKERAKDKERAEKERSTAAVKSGAEAVNGVASAATATIPAPATVGPTTIRLSNSTTVNLASLPTPTVNLGVPANVASLGLTGAGSAVVSASAACIAVGAVVVNGTAPTVGSAAVTNSAAAAASSSPATATAGGTVLLGGAGSTSLAAGVGSASSTVAASAVGALAGAAPPSAVAGLLGVKLESKFANAASLGNFAGIKLEDTIRGIPAKKMRLSIDGNSSAAVSTEKDKTEVSTASPESAETRDVCVGTSVGTITEPDCLGPCEPGTTVTLEGIVWQETEGGVLVVNVTWRGKTYVGTLLDCTKHDWAPPRFCESPTSDVESRTPKGRGKRGRGGAAAAAATSASNAVDPSNFTETRSSMHSKLRNAGKGGRRTNNSAGFTAPPSPAKLWEGLPLIGAGVKRKGRPSELELNPPVPGADSSRGGGTNKRSRTSQSRSTPTGSASATSVAMDTQQAPPSSPVLIECPEPNCSKKYKHINGLRYHQTHAHQAGNVSTGGVGVGSSGSAECAGDSPDEQMPKDVVSSENDESTQESSSVSPSPVGGASSGSSSSEKTPRPFTGKVPQPPAAAGVAAPASEHKPTVPIVSSTSTTTTTATAAPSTDAAATLPTGLVASEKDAASTASAAPASSSSSSSSNCAAEMTGDAKGLAAIKPGAGVPCAVAAANANGSSVLRFGPSAPVGVNNASPVAGSHLQPTEATAVTAPLTVATGASAAATKVSSPCPASGTMPVITSTSTPSSTSLRPASPPVASAAPPSLSPAPHLSPRHPVAYPPPQSQQQPLPPHQQQLVPPGDAQSSQLYQPHHYQHHHHHQFAHPGGPGGPLIAECPTGSGMALAAPPSSSALARVSATGPPVGPPHSLSPSVAPGSAGAMGPGSPTSCDKVKVKLEKPDKYRMRVSSSPSSCGVPLGPASPATPSSCSTPPIPNLTPSTHLVGGQQPLSASPNALKPIQPKPGGAVGEAGCPSTLPVSVDSIKKEKSKHRSKKSRDRDRERKSGSGGSAYGGSGGLHGAEGFSPDGHADRLNGSVYARMPVGMGGGSGKENSGRLSGSSVDLPLDLNTSSADHVGNESVQSPAYSDISDANDTASGMESESLPPPPPKEKEKSGKVASGEQQSSVAPGGGAGPPAAHNLNPYGVYSYYGQSPYVVPPMSSSSSATQSPPVSRIGGGGSGGVDRVIKEEVPGLSEKAEDKSNKEREVSAASASKHWSERSSSGGSGRGGPPTLAPGHAGDRSSAGDPDRIPQMVVGPGGHPHSHAEYQMMREHQHQQQQKLLQQQYAYYGYNFQYQPASDMSWYEGKERMMMMGGGGMPPASAPSYPGAKEHHQPYPQHPHPHLQERPKEAHHYHPKEKTGKDSGSASSKGADHSGEKMGPSGGSGASSSSELAKQMASGPMQHSSKSDRGDPRDSRDARDPRDHHHSSSSSSHHHHHHSQRSSSSHSQSSTSGGGSSSSSSSGGGGGGGSGGGHAPPGSKVEAVSASLKDKKFETHQILKENIELKSQMDKKGIVGGVVGVGGVGVPAGGGGGGGPAASLNYERYDSMMYQHQRHEELMRYLLFQDKIEHQKNSEEMQQQMQMQQQQQQQQHPQHRKEESSGPMSSNGIKHQGSSSSSSTKDSPKPSVGSLPSSASMSSRASASPKTPAGSKGDPAGGINLSMSGSGSKKDHGGDGGSSLDSKDKKDGGERGGSASRAAQEGQKPTMETQGPPPPTSSYAYMHHAYMQPPHYGTLAFDPAVYRGSMNPMMMSAAGHHHYANSPYLHHHHPQIRYHVPGGGVPPTVLPVAVGAPGVDPQGGGGVTGTPDHHHLSPKLHPTKALDMLQHHATQYYSSQHKIHELQEHAAAIKSPVGASVGVPGGVVGSAGSGPGAAALNVSKLVAESAAAASSTSAVTAGVGIGGVGKKDSLGGVGVGNHDRCSPPLQRHLHTHLHTHVPAVFSLYPRDRAC